jgi:uncharacterized protein YggE
MEFAIAPIQLNDRTPNNAGSDLVIWPHDVLYVIGNGQANGCADIYTRNGKVFPVVETVTQVHDAIVTRVTSYLTALGDPT